MHTNSTHYIVYQAYGAEDILHEAFYSILSLFRLSPVWAVQNSTIVIYTDQPEWFRKRLDAAYPVVYEEITADRLKEWRGAIDFVHRVKIRMLQDFASKYQGNLLYLDTDTYFLEDVQEVFRKIDAGMILMHVSEGKIVTRRNPIFRKTYKFLKQHTFSLAGKTIAIPLETEMWNAGVIGIQHRHHRLLEDVLSLTDEMYTRYPKHIMEQLAFSYVLSREQRLAPASESIFHYWNFKEFRQVMRQFFVHYQDKPTKDLVLLSERIQPYELMKPKLEYENLSSWKRTWRKLKRDKWSMPRVEL